jgi:hypothetical protein
VDHIPLKEATVSRGFDFGSFEMDEFRESDFYDGGREIGVGREAVLYS